MVDRNAPDHTPIPAWMRDPADQKWILDFYRKSGIALPGVNSIF